MQFPDTEKWKEIADGFEKIWNLPNCCGSMNGKHVRIKCPACSGSEFFNYKKFFSIILFALCDHRYRFLYVNIGDSGRHSDSGVFINSALGELMNRNAVGLPNPDHLPGSAHRFPYFFVGDDAFPLRINIMKPYSGNGLLLNKQIFNMRISRARRVVENAFGILSSKFQIFYNMMQCEVDLAELVVKAAVILHNFIIDTKQTSPNMGDTPRVDGKMKRGLWRAECTKNQGLAFGQVHQVGSKNYTKASGNLRNILCEYLTWGPGSVSWQFEPERWVD